MSVLDTERTFFARVLQNKVTAATGIHICDVLQKAGRIDSLARIHAALWYEIS